MNAHSQVKGTKITKRSDDTSFAVVGIGASAGGLEAFTEFLKALPTTTGMAFVLIQHLDPNHESILTSLLAKTTTMPVKEVTDAIQVTPNHVYVIPPNSELTIKSGILNITPRREDGKLHLPINHFFTSLADDRKNNAIGIVLSGTASDGTLGLAAIKAKKGTTFAQDEETAKFKGMPTAAIESGSVDFVLSPKNIALELSRISKQQYIHESKTNSIEESTQEENISLGKIFSLLKKNTGVDFHHYKHATIDRRIKRRMHLHKLNNLDGYAEYLQDNSGETDVLFKDLLINVTSFFRDPGSLLFFKEKVLPRLIENKSSKESLRVWVAGCATGEEAYSLAIVLTEYLRSKSLNIPIQIFGSDLSQSAIDKARKGLYTQNDLHDVSARRIKDFFIKVGNNYQVTDAIRDICIFAPHNVFKDPPFSRLDLISCCNLLIYVDTELQEKILRSFHYALKPSGHLVLGKSEGIGTSINLFTQIDRKYKLFMRKDTKSRGIVDFGSQSSQKNNVKKESLNNEENLLVTIDIEKITDALLLRHHTPASVVIDSDLEIIQFRGSTDEYLSHTDGKASINLMKMAKGDLWLELRTAISKAKKSWKPYRKENIQLALKDKSKSITIEVDPLKTTEGDIYYLIIFEQTQSPLINSADSKKSSINKTRRNVQLEQELIQTRADMRSITEEQEATNEELQSANEEILSSNEELQSINEELETSKEELESTNEELLTVNEELQTRNAELTEARDYAQAIIRTVHSPLLILDKNLRVRTANRAFFQTFQVDEKNTEGNFIYDLGKGQWDIPALRKLLNEILPKNNIFDNYEVEHSFPSIGHKIMLLNARKFYKDGENILLAIEDITERKNYENQKDEFIGITSHELKTPITTMKAFAQILQKRIGQSGDKRDVYLLKNINSQADRLTNIINDLLNVNKIEAGKLTLNKKKFDLDALIKKVVVDFQYTVETHTLIKEGSINELVYGDESSIEQVLTNLITNAIKYSSQADKVVLNILTDKRNAIVRVQDFGFGIAKNDQERIFERFYRTSDKEKNNVSGFGLGLYISSEIIKRHHGKLWVESTIGKGSTFIFLLPLKSKDE